MKRYMVSAPKLQGGQNRFSQRIRASRDSFNKPAFRSSWDAQSEKGEDRDYLYELGKSQEYNINVDHGQSVQYIDHLFAGSILGQKSDIADGSLRKQGDEFRTFNNLVGDYYVAPRFLEAIGLHLAKNLLVSEMDRVRVPLILAIWGGKGQGKSFQTELSFKKMGIEPIVMSAGELESEVAGQPGQLIRERYKRAAEVCRVQGKMSCLIINDIDAGLGRFKNTQVTVNNQIVVATLMSLCDNPEFVSVGDTWDVTKKIQNRIPIIVTGNALGTMFAPLIRDGRMDKFYWTPNEDELVETIYQLFKDDDVSKEDVRVLLKTFPGQSLDFFGAIRSATYDTTVKEWLEYQMGGGFADPGTDMTKMRQLFLKRNKDGQLDLRGVPFQPPTIAREALLEQGRRIVAEQDYINKLKLGQQYLKHWGKPAKQPRGGMVGFNG